MCTEVFTGGCFLEISIPDKSNNACGLAYYSVKLLCWNWTPSQVFFEDFAIIIR